MNKGIQNLAGSYLEDSKEEQMSSYRDRNYSLVESELQKQTINERVDKNPRNFSPYDFEALFKIVLIGDSNTGKTSMLLRFADNVFVGDYLCTIGVDFKIKTLKVDNKVVKMQIWDTAGQERFRSISLAYYRNSHGCIAVYDIANRASFDSIEEQILSFISSSAQDAAKNIILVGNKSDLDSKRRVSFEDAVKLSRKLNLAGCFETSAKENNSIEDVFFRSIVNCVDQTSTSARDSFHEISMSRSRGYSAQTSFTKRDSIQQYIQGTVEEEEDENGNVVGKKKSNVNNRFQKQQSLDEKRFQQQNQLFQMQMGYKNSGGINSNSNNKSGNGSASNNLVKLNKGGKDQQKKNQNNRNNNGPNLDLACC